ncbi:translation factor GTPase family protein [Actinoplanes sp. NPDC049316]|uniref:translation factor GTPase family protein n=1 Tax=Actinoplanes sp. NPDC049316 TaxID=3154727 RepID=UPI00343EF1E4
MPSTPLNLGILAHVDAGKTSLTERLLFEHGVIAAPGSVDAGSTQTDSGELERERGITIRAAVASFRAGDLRVNLIDTPGHPDFIAEVERALAVLDAAVLVISAVEGVQAQTRVLLRSLRRLGLPVVFFVNKIDRTGARTAGLLDELRSKLDADVVAVTAVRDPGTPAATTRPDRSLDELRGLIAEETATGRLHPVFFGSALTGQGVRELAAGLTTLLRPPPPSGAAAGLVFAVERASGGEKVAYLRLFGGEVRERQRLRLTRPGGGVTGRVTGLSVVGSGGKVLTAGGIARVRGLSGVRVGDRLGDPDRPAGAQFSPPGLEALVTPRHPGLEARLHAALTSLADEDPLIRTRAAGGGRTSVLLYGAVQREVIAERLARDFGVEAVFGDVQPVYAERLTGTGHAETAFDKRGGSDFWATIGLRVAPGPAGSGLRYRNGAEWGAVPRAFHVATEEAVRRTLDQGLYGWEVLDCTVTVTRIGWKSPTSTAADFRGLAPVVLLRALQRAGTRVHEPCHTVELEVPGEALSTVLGALSGLGAEISGTVPRADGWVVTGELPSRLVQELTRALPGLTHGEGALWSRPGRDRPVRGPAPVRPRLDGDPLDREAYLRFLAAPSLAR